VEATLDSPSRRALARRAAEEGIVLLRNAKAMLPLRGLGSAIKTVAVIGPNADNAHSTQGGYTNGNAHVVTVLAAVVEAANASGNAWRVVYERGACLGATPLCACPIPANDTVPGCGITDTGRVSIAAAVARAADVTILVLGDSSTILAGNGSGHHEEGTCGEHFDRDNLDPVGAQLPLLKAVAAASSKVILTLIHGACFHFAAASFLPSFLLTLYDIMSLSNSRSLLPTLRVLLYSHSRCLALFSLSLSPYPIVHLCITSLQVAP
jgi:hypothetical protein